VSRRIGDGNHLRAGTDGGERQATGDAIEVDLDGHGEVAFDDFPGLR